jgi:Tn3 transposase DDE domain
VVNVIVLWNTLCMDPALAQLRAEGHQAREDVACLSPLGFEHINMLGRYAFIVPDIIADGKLRPVRDLASASTQNEEPVLTQVFRSVAPHTPRSSRVSVARHPVRGTLWKQVEKMPENAEIITG